jgi:hypothetical protein
MILMKIILGITVIVTILAIGILGINTSSSSNSINNAYAQEGFQTEDLVNETIDLGNTTTSNATLVFAQEGSITPEEINNTMQIFNDTSMKMNATLPVSLTGNNTAKPMD